jgi:hypothetical protein
MIRHLTSAAALALAVAATPLLAQAGGMRAELAAPVAREGQLYIDGVVWNCAGQACTARAADPRPAIACRKLARKVGTVARFSGRAELDAAGLATCNQDQG